MARTRLHPRGLPDGWVKRWPSGYFGPRGQVVRRLPNRLWEILWPDGRYENTTTLREAVTR